MDILVSRRLNGWSLLYLIMGINAVAVIAYMPTQDLSVTTGVSEMIQMSVRCTVPFLYLAFVPSALNSLFPGNFSHCMLRNCRYVSHAYTAGLD